MNPLTLLLSSIFLSTTLAQEPVECSSSTQCSSGQICSTERGDCNAPSGCSESGFCPAVCTGFCIESDSPFTVSSTLSVQESYTSLACSSCQPILWLHLVEGIDRKLPSNAEYSITVEQYFDAIGEFGRINSDTGVVLTTDGLIEAVSLALPVSATNVFPYYAYFTITIEYKNSVHTWVVRTKQVNDVTVETSISSENPSDSEVDSLLNPPTLEPTATAKTFPDVQPNSLLETSLKYLTEREIISGHPDGTFKPYDQVNRAEAAKFLLNSKYGQVSTRPEQLFPDVPLNAWYTPFVTFAYKLNIINGYPDGTFKPAQTVNTAEFLKMISLTFSTELNTSHPYIDSEEGDWFNQYAGTASKYNLFPHRVQYKLYPELLLTRGEVAIAMYKLLIAQ